MKQTKKKEFRHEYRFTYRQIPHFVQWYGFLSVPVKCLHIEQKYAESFVLHLAQVWASWLILKKKKVLKAIHI